MLLAALGLPCFRAPLDDGVGEPMLEAPREISQIAGRNAWYGGRPRPRLSTPERCLHMAGGTEPPPTRAESGGSGRHSWRWCGGGQETLRTSRCVVGWQLCKVPHGWNPETKQEYPLDEEGVWACWIWTPGPEWERDNS
jgi:hypothetical protein